MARTGLNLVFVESFLGGSHEAFAKGWIAESRHNWRLIGLPAERWKWRLRSGAMTLGPELAALDPPVDGVVASSLLDLAHLRQLSGPFRDRPFLLYMHENQFHYPRPSGEPLDRSFATAHLASFLVADSIAWNSRSHLRSTKAALEEYLPQMPAPRPEGVADALEARSEILPPGVDLSGFPQPSARPTGQPPVIAWNHRWDGDKRPAAFAHVLFKLAEKEKAFELVLLGCNEHFRPAPLLAIRERLGDRILRDGSAESREEYIHWLQRADFSVSTADQENFGYATVEAMAAGALPLMPRRLAYPELLPEELSKSLLYENDRDLIRRLGDWLDEPELSAQHRAKIMAAARDHTWPGRAAGLDDWVEEVVTRRSPGS